MTESMHPYKKHLYNTQNLNYSADQIDSERISNADGLVTTNDLNELSIDGNEDVDFSNSEDFNELYQDLVKPPQFTHERSLTEPTSNNNSSLSLGSDAVRSSRQQRTKSVDLSHMYMLNNSNDTQLTSTNESVADISHQMITRYLGTDNNTSLMPRLKTIEMYRENVKKSKDPKLLFEYAQYMLQTALTIDSNTSSLGLSNDITGNSNEKDISSKDLKKQFLKDAQHYLKKLSSKGYSDAQYLLGDAYSSGAFGKISNKESFILFQAAAKHGHIESAYRTAHCYEEGLGTTRDARKALNFLKFAASRNHPSAMFKLGLYSFNGRMGLPNDVNTKQNGIKWLSRASARANELTNAAPYELAKIYENGFLDLIIPDEKYAMELYIQAAALGHTPSATLLGQLYETGNSVITQDVSLSVHYYTQAAVQGNDPTAMLGLCAWYLLGAEPAFKRDETEAFQWASKAANLGLPKAQFTLGYFYENGKGCEQDEIAAKKWYTKAARNNDQRAIRKIRKQENLNKSTETDNSTNQPVKKHGHKKSKSVTTMNLFSMNSNNNQLDEDPLNDNVQDIQDNDYLEVQQMDTPKFFSNPNYKHTPQNSINNTASKNNILGETSDNTINKTANNITNSTGMGMVNDNTYKMSENSKKKDQKLKNKKKKDCVIM
ncbi:similar to Saccharomyces cerevisiae YER096W SHC1 Sporulation-specific activator of Chs3p (chitin synthase III), required for the synthesis of the chitosan layer of ascospores [Maudiozyma saulgeensis]|uniref:Similar to Saccharomyces cerevisiae YER096W SHC1 Sporulation-specific activator of Chs3p (Chitin synthase III), required for the synthesis of the chitosan layer of ascospores n=1 Tax=Maudiozyma saulgeensis TaxID=1789683 RepID=A0A1X7R4V2_9SACH|nr:similar to Saccharomyces cerevisiae YER096W SHC1 Sporulation-specific activator of Chs3p (chitin synthase III), required for the synthesis of the chitosan layer of ascospores [Kazachstania saulgeensis]